MRADPVDWHSMAGWKRFVLMGLMVSLPVPVFAASGLAAPLPSIVYRVAVGVAEQTQSVALGVPGLEAVVAETKEVAREGTIRLSAEELAVASAPARSRTSPAKARPKRAGRSPRFAGRSVHRSRPTKRSTRRAAPGTLKQESRKVAAPDLGEFAQESRASARSKPARDQREPLPVGTPSGGSSGDPGHSPEPTRNPPKEEPKTGPGRDSPPPPPAAPEPPPAPPPPSLPPLPVTPPIDPLPDPRPLTPKAQLHGIAAELRELGHARNADRVAQALEKVESAIQRLEKSPPDNQGAIGDIRNAVQKLDAAQAEGEISLAERTLFVTRLNAVSQLLKVAP